MKSPRTPAYRPAASFRRHPVRRATRLKEANLDRRVPAVAARPSLDIAAVDPKLPKKGASIPIRSRWARATPRWTSLPSGRRRRHILRDEGGFAPNPLQVSGCAPFPLHRAGGRGSGASRRVSESSETPLRAAGLSICFVCSSFPRLLSSVLPPVGFLGSASFKDATSTRWSGR